MQAAMGLAPKINLPFLAGEVNDAHRQVTFHGKSMLMEAKRAGEALLKAKAMVRHGEFKAWIETNCRCSYPRAAKYMRIAKCIGVDTFEGGIDAFLDAHATPRKSPAEPAGALSASICPFTHDDAEHALKLARMAGSGNENEAAVAQTKLDRFAEGFGMTGEEAQARAEKMLPAAGLAPLEAQKQQLKSEIIAPFAGMSKPELLEVIFDLILKMSRQ